MEFERFFPFWGQLTAVQQERFRQSMTKRTVKKGTIVSHGSRDCTGLILVDEGRLRAYISSDEGKEITVFRLLDMDICLFSASCIIRSLQFDIIIEAETDTSLWVIPPMTYKSLMEESAPVANFTNGWQAVCPMSCGLSSRSCGRVWISGLQLFFWKNPRSRAPTRFR